MEAKKWEKPHYKNHRK